jgi:hypothetical protein
MTAPTSFREALPGLTQTSLREIDRTRGVGARAESEFFNRALNFDARTGAAETAQGIAGDLSTTLARNLELARGQAAGSGRLNTGFFDVDRSRLFEDFNSRLANAIAQQSLQAQALNQRNIQGIGAFGQNVSNRFINLLGGATQAGVEEQSMRNQQRGGLFGTLLGAAGGIGVGIATGNPMAGIAAGKAISGAAS